MKPIVIDGAQGEGGGQVLRTSLGLAAHLGRPLVVENVRAGRRKPGLLRQHLTALRAVAEICDGKVEGATLGSKRIVLSPGAVKPGTYHFAVGSAGSAILVLQTVLWPLLLGPGKSQLTLEGGTHNPMAPTFDYLERTFFPVIRRMGATIHARLERHGFYPAGGGRLVVEIASSTLSPLHVEKAARVTHVEAEAIVAELPAKIAQRELSVVRRELDLGREATRVVRASSPGPGNVVNVIVHRENITELVSTFGEKRRRAEDVAQEACDRARAYLAAERPVGEYLADQLVIPLALAGGRIRCTTPSLHTRTNVALVERLLDRPVHLTEEDGGAVLSA